MSEPSEVFDHPRFVGLWTYRPYGGRRRFSASVMVAGSVQETDMCDTWAEAVQGARDILKETE
ncbi:MAG: hypothetical protein IH988_05455 [Planctomycetes bacterium]|nr:hypothetical protein [Planctomycetota bacterium]